MAAEEAAITTSSRRLSADRDQSGGIRLEGSVPVSLAPWKFPNRCVVYVDELIARWSSNGPARRKTAKALFATP